ncbi:lipoate--protein ligase family protein, partial [Francisella tularensis subsp. holarctica]|nr:lipoate--protein ligase family protein [Francisella tularensis subsp. holarctica]
MDIVKIPFISRHCGGGKVFYVYGNLNYTIISTKKEHDIKANLELLCNAIKKLVNDLYHNRINDIVLDHNN